MPNAVGSVPPVSVAADVCRERCGPRGGAHVFSPAMPGHRAHARSCAGTIGATGIPVSADVDVTGWVLNFQGARTVLDAERATVNILAGARYLDVDSKLTSSLGSAGPPPTATQSASVWDGVIGVKGNVNITRRFQLVDATLYLMGKRWGVFNGKEVSAYRVYGGTKCGALGSVVPGSIGIVYY